jgi:hypothetical protein
LVPRDVTPQGRTSVIRRSIDGQPRNPLIHLRSHSQSESKEKRIKDGVDESHRTGDDGSVGQFEGTTEDDVSGEDEDDGAGSDGGEAETLG